MGGEIGARKRVALIITSAQTASGFVPCAGLRDYHVLKMLLSDINGAISMVDQTQRIIFMDLEADL